MKRRVILLDPPGSGKGTVAAGLEKEYSLPHVSSGHLIRNEIAQKSPLGHEAKLFLDKGRLVPDELVLKLMNASLSQLDPCKGFVLDGFPRTLRQAQTLDAWLKAVGRPIESVICFEALESGIIQRLSARRTCSRCGRSYQIPEIAPRMPGICDDCQGALVQ